MRFIQPPWENYFFSRIQTLESSLLLVSPYIKYPTAALIYAVLQGRQNASLSVQILTRISIQDLNEGASDLEAFEQLLQLSKLPGIDVVMKYISNLHAKVYIFDHSSAIITSSNLTPSGMKSNIEYGIELADLAAIQQIRSEMNRYWIDAETVTPEIIEQVKDRLGTIESVVTISPRPKQGSAASTNKAVSPPVPIISKRLTPQGQDTEFMELGNLRENILSTRTKRRKKARVVISMPTDIAVAEMEGELEDGFGDAEELSEQESIIEIESSYRELEQQSVEVTISELNSDDKETGQEAIKRLKALYVLDKQYILPHIDELAVALSELVMARPHSCYRLLRAMQDPSIVPLIARILGIVKDERGMLPWPLLKLLHNIAPDILASVLSEAVRETISLSAKRNAVCYLTELGPELGEGSSIISALRYLTNDADRRISEIAFKCMGKVGGVECTDYLRDAWKRSQSKKMPLQVQIGILQGLVAAGAVRQEQELFFRLTYSHIDQFRSVSAKALQQLGMESWHRLVEMARSDFSGKVRAEAVKALADIDSAAARRLLVDLAENELETSVKTVIHEQLNRLYHESFGELPEAQRRSILQEKLEELQSSERKVRLKAIRFFGKVRDTSVVQTLHFALKDDDGIVRAVAAEALGSISDPASFAPLVEVIETDSYHHARAAAAKALGMIGDKRAVDVLKRSLDDKSGEVQKWADRSLEALGMEMIPKNITAEHIRKAISRLGASQLPVETTMGNHILRYGGRDYSPREVMSLSNEYANGECLDMSGFTDIEVERFLKERGFSITAKSNTYTPVEIPSPRGIKSLPLEDRVFAQRYGYSPGSSRKDQKDREKVLPKSKRRKLNKKLIHELSDVGARRARRRKRR